MQSKTPKMRFRHFRNTPYAMGRLQDQDAPVWRALREKMKGALLRTFLDCGGEAHPEAPAPLSLSRGDYAALVGYLSNASNDSLNAR